MKLHSTVKKWQFCWSGGVRDPQPQNPRGKVPPTAMLSGML